MFAKIKLDFLMVVEEPYQSLFIPISLLIRERLSECGEWKVDEEKNRLQQVDLQKILKEKEFTNIN